MEDKKPVREYEISLGGIPFTIQIMNEPSKEAIAEFNKGLDLIAEKYLNNQPSSC